MDEFSIEIRAAIEAAVKRTSGGELPDTILRECFESNARSNLRNGTEQSVIETLNASGLHKLDISPSRVPPSAGGG